MPAVDLATLPFVPCNHRTPRTEQCDLIVIHTNEGPEGPTSAEGLAQYLRGVDPGYHVVVDENSAVRCCEDDHTVWGAGGVNSRAWHLCLTGWSAQSVADWHDAESTAAIEIAAELVRQAAAKFGIPVQRITDPRGASRGICGHVDVSRYFTASMGHTDPGPAFPWAEFIDRVRGSSPTPPTSGGFMPDLSPEEQRELLTIARNLDAFKNEITHPNDELPWGGALIKLSQVHSIASDLRDGFTGSAQTILDQTVGHPGLKRGIAALRQNVFNALGNTVAIGAAVGATVKKAVAPHED